MAGTGFQGSVGISGWSTFNYGYGAPASVTFFWSGVPINGNPEFTSAKSVNMTDLYVEITDQGLQLRQVFHLPLTSSGTFNYSGMQGASTFQGDTLVYNFYVVYTDVHALGGGQYTVPILNPPPPPPSPPSPGNLSGLVATDSVSSVKLAWNALGSGSGYTTYYNVYRSINGAAETYLGNTTGNTFTDNNPGTVRPITYRVQPYANGNGSTYSGSTYGGAASVTLVVLYKWSLWDGTSEIPGLTPSIWDGSKEITPTTQVSG